MARQTVRLSAVLHSLAVAFLLVLPVLLVPGRAVAQRASDEDERCAMAGDGDCATCVVTPPWAGSSLRCQYCAPRNSCLESHVSEQCSCIQTTLKQCGGECAPAFTHSLVWVALQYALLLTIVLMLGAGLYVTHAKSERLRQQRRDEAEQEDDQRRQQLEQEAVLAMRMREPDSPAWMRAIDAESIRSMTQPSQAA